MLGNALRYIWGILRRSPELRPLLALIRFARLKFRRVVRDRPYLALGAIACVCIFIVFNPEYSPYVPEPECGYVQLEDGQLYGKTGNELILGGARPCEPRTIQALEFYNHSNVELERNGNFVPAVSAGLFLRETARDVNMKNHWHEYTLFTESNNFLWVPAESGGEMKIEQFVFDKGECTSKISYENQNVDSEIREGVVIRSRGLRSDPSMPYDTWRKCNFGAPGKKGFEECNYMMLEFFLPVGTPRQRCPAKSINDIWRGGGTKKAVLAEGASYNTLTELAAARWDKARIAPVAIETYKRLTSKLPKICMRWIRTTDAEPSGWEEFATVAALWCDL
ncbi:hypothetical protein GGQ64_004601 [Rhizobium azooxidifex]|uniref:Uncharacterized protein n=1 Tax=Mycoplana azooxidifex TaxID=1636188 RepID=A0A7W6DDQ7_9HYPH|nr:hypothetical protein [Mycoplana azooxidifex]MBB3979361.1 hypothetical protein [Mycoplana azooxidifex]